jgi:NH3-dependent NAD+ synthetase
MKEITNYGKVFETLVQKTQDYIVGNNLSAMVLGISGGIDSTVVAAICHEVSKRTNIPLIGRSLPTTNNKTNEVSTADLVGKAFCNDYKVYPIDRFYHQFMIDIVHKETGSVRYIQNEYTGGFTIDLEDCLKFQTPIANGNIQARLRMIYLYNLASIYGGLVMDTDNLTENNLGYFTIHGDVGDFNPIGGLWKTEVFKLAEFLVEKYSVQSHFFETLDIQKTDHSDYARCNAVAKSLKLKPTAGLGITNDDLEELGAESYDQVDAILQEILAWKTFNRDNNITYANKKDEKEAFLNEQQMLTYPIEVISSVADRHFSSEFKRAKLPVVIERISYLI